MAPRRYTQRGRAESAAETERRIRAAALELYRQRGVAATTLQAIAARADVARGTVLNHFGSGDGLLEAVLDEIVAKIRYPDEQLQEGAESESERIRRYVDAMFRFYVRGEEDWPAFSRDLDLPILKAREAHYYAIVARLYAATFLDLAEDRIVGAATRAYVNFAPLHDLRAAGLSLDEAIDVVADTLIDLVARRRKEAPMKID
jgi:AcrR family transcriptional regulator